MATERHSPFNAKVGRKDCANLHLFFAYTGSVFNVPQTRLCDFTIRCKGCGENIPAPVETVPDTWIVADCPLCGAKRRYLPGEIFRGRLSARLAPCEMVHAGRNHV